VPDIHNIWDDGRDEEDDDMDMDDFIDYDEEEDGGVPMDEKAREKRRREKRQEQERRKRARGVRPEVEGIDAKWVFIHLLNNCYWIYSSAWDELHDVFGDGLDYDWALDDDDVEFEEELKPEMKLADVSIAVGLIPCLLTARLLRFSNLRKFAKNFSVKTMT
jgi:transcription elongation factor SPT6